ncbi:hypothetical protein TBCH5v1_2278 [Thermococcus barophilus]|uniref:Uncharacterized protein n=1 Tax=Thermococcus barophilus TaxID=55802 RepID=A0A0S1XEN4_THEBA|nr:hypothetical protein TBCH5v1_2278 [Thermococcus barophilus]
MRLNFIKMMFEIQKKFSKNKCNLVKQKIVKLKVKRNTSR